MDSIVSSPSWVLVLLLSVLFRQTLMSDVSSGWILDVRSVPCSHRIFAPHHQNLLNARYKFRPAVYSEWVDSALTLAAHYSLDMDRRRLCKHTCATRLTNSLQSGLTKSYNLASVEQLAHRATLKAEAPSDWIVNTWQTQLYKESKWWSTSFRLTTKDDTYRKWSVWRSNFSHWWVAFMCL